VTNVLLAVLIVLVAAGLLHAPARAWLRARRGDVDVRPRPTLIVHTRDRQSIRGALVPRSEHDHPDCVVLTHATWLVGAKPAGVGGTALIPRENYSWAQDITGLVDDAAPRVQAVA
jgi:hypothetical protein